MHTLGVNDLAVLDNFISPEECHDLLHELKFCYWQPSQIIHRAQGGLQTEVRRTFRASSTTDQEWFAEPLLTLIAELEKRLRAAFGTQSSHFEPWQATRYGRGGCFDYHVDCGFWEGSQAGERTATYLLYLDTPARGGQTHFRALNQTVEARTGRLLAWNNLLPGGGCNHAMIHSGLEVKKGRKTTLVTWQREKPVRKERIQ